MTLKNKLNRFKKHMVNIEEDHKAANIDSLSEMKIVETIDIPHREKWTEFQAKPFYFDNQYSIIREVSYPLDYLHGFHRFNELYDVVDLWGKKAVEHPLSFSKEEPSRMVFFDTETTGLGGGVGNTIFLIGYAQVFSDYVVVKQHFLPSPSNEVALYQGFLTDIGDYQSMKLTTYNGKAFDWPQIKTRHTLLRDTVPKLPAFGHFDLLHAARRLWKNNLPSVRLSIVEKEILNIKRDHDVPGYLAPMLYFDFLKDHNPKGLEGVFIHNEIDVLSLITLYIHIAKKLLIIPTIYTSMEEKYEIARWYEAVGQINLAISLYENLAYSPNQVAYNAAKALGRLYKKQKRYEKASQIWTRLIESNSAVDVEIATELSKLYEHQHKDYEKALYYATMSYNAWKNKKRIIRTTARQEKTAFLKRIERLQEKINS
ncbi:ribonuclease H-like domain-containing protein [Schinkia azotoformans]|uniref:ribonuclease H-like domain-containing protein n=1 Tax=Schinkia azotoformans TaxID=1454 RepID=UPI002DBCF59D|nr:ribonuclease H-like domain-containing protein [Schinkia azotoformans]MEC1739360.1 ribonuclease H-like domain-containing protein [Schinkia azotoformans]MEC1765900.1 ribonuclease H-like domain-containing protein [Schinkia azotoformans]MEC1785895.1 ribonuclease H-like domain-containing protein [Schinkia azotoformans]MED4377144.1 ribonuclease H-like domain-containing protein [Schinkia azotoformans]MED4418126.1 ribonuclease H-like domain-containing protein [Schinkia azotoformans]